MYIASEFKIVSLFNPPGYVTTLKSATSYLKESLLETHWFTTIPSKRSLFQVRNWNGRYSKYPGQFLTRPRVNLLQERGIRK